MGKTKNVIFSAALAMLFSPFCFASDMTALYKDAVSLWNSDRADSMVLTLNNETLRSIEAIYGSVQTSELTLKRDQVKLLLAHYRACALDRQDTEAARKYLVPEFKAQILYSFERGCSLKTKKQTAAVTARALAGVENLSKTNALLTQEGGAVLFDGAVSCHSQVPAPVTGGQTVINQAPATLTIIPAHNSTLASPVAALTPEKSDIAKIEASMPDINKYGRVHQARNFWKAVYTESLAGVKNTEASQTDRAIAGGKLAAAGAFRVLLFVSNLPEVERSAARLGWKVGNNASGKEIAWESFKLGFHMNTTMVAFLALPVINAVRMAVPGSKVILGILAVDKIACKVNKYVLHIID